MSSTVNNLQSYLESQGLINGSTEWPSSRRRVHDEAGDRLVILSDDGGTNAMPSEDGTMGDAALADPAVQVLVRSAAWDSDDAQAHAQLICDALNGLRAVTMGDRFYLRVVAQSAEPIFIGYDEKHRPQFTQSFRCARSAQVESS